MNRPIATTTIAALCALLLLAGPAVAGDEENPGKATYDANCSSCHGMTGKGDGPVAAALNPKPRDFSTGEFKLDADKSGTPGEDADLKLVIKVGAMMYGGSPLMAGFSSLSDEEIDQVIAHIRSLKP